MRGDEVAPVVARARTRDHVPVGHENEDVVEVLLERVPVVGAERDRPARRHHHHDARVFGARHGFRVGPVLDLRGRGEPVVWVEDVHVGRFDVVMDQAFRLCC